LFIINCKNYEEIAGEKLTKLVNVTSKVSKKYKIKIVIAPPIHQISQITKFAIPVLAQHVDTAETGSTTGFIVPELLKKSKVLGAIINHSEHRISSKNISKLIQRLRKLNLMSVVCVKNVAEAKKYAKHNPDYIAIEPPELIGSGKAVSKQKPELITNASHAITQSKNSTKLLCGAGIVSGDDVKKAIELGSKGILVASGIIKAKNWNKIIDEFAKAMI